MNTPKTIIFIGPQGSGKGTQIAKLSAHLKERDSEHTTVDIQTGRRFRGLAAQGEGFTETHVAETIDTGVLQPLFLSVVLWGSAMRDHLDPTRNAVFDGFPRTPDEARVLESALRFYERGHLDIINLDTPEEIVRERMVARARTDDTNASIEARLNWYRTETLAVLAYYRSRAHTTVHDIDGTKNIDEVHAAIVVALNLT